MSIEPIPEDLSHAEVEEASAYRRALGAFATGVCVVTADTADGPMGITVKSFTSVSLNPRLVLWCIDERSDRWPVFAAAERFAIHVLPASDRELASRFAKGVCTLSEGEFTRVGEGPPGLPEALARFDCAAHDRIQMGDHMILVGRVERFSGSDGEALTYFRGRYGRVAEA